ncbi:hypothetical protein BDR05DRAFT_970396, partial [Suillus weaverae]
ETTIFHLYDLTMGRELRNKFVSLECAAISIPPAEIKTVQSQPRSPSVFVEIDEIFAKDNFVR